jgi:hypothetical protein
LGIEIAEDFHGLDREIRDDWDHFA